MIYFEVDIYSLSTNYYNIACLLPIQYYILRSTMRFVYNEIKTGLNRLVNSNHYQYNLLPIKRVKNYLF